MTALDLCQFLKRADAATYFVVSVHYLPSVKKAGNLFQYPFDARLILIIMSS